MRLFVIEDELHAELIGEFGDPEAATVELQRLAGIPWDQEPNQAPCTSWRSCGRIYEVVEFEVEAGQWKELNRSPGFEISAEGVKWDPTFAGAN